MSCIHIGGSRKFRGGGGSYLKVGVWGQSPQIMKVFFISKLTFVAGFRMFKYYLMLVWSAVLIYGTRGACGRVGF